MQSIYNAAVDVVDQRVSRILVSAIHKIRQFISSHFVVRSIPGELVHFFIYLSSFAHNTSFVHFSIVFVHVRLVRYNFIRMQGNKVGGHALGVMFK